MARPRETTVGELLTALAVGGPARSAALRGALGGISPATLGRLAAAAGNDVIRFGRGSETRYARTRAIEGLGRSLPVFRVDETGEPRAAGALHLLWGSHTLWREDDASRLFAGLPPVFADMAPQGYLGRNFAVRFRDELRVPPRLDDWSDDHRLLALARRGEDCVGDLIVGDESLERFLSSVSEDVAPSDYPALAERTLAGAVGSSAGGERPKVGVYSGGRHVLVKFAKDTGTDVARRWRDLLWCEWRALETIGAAGRTAPRARCLDVGEWRFLEVERFDRIGERGRRAVISLFALNNEYLGTPTTWTSAVPLLRERPFLLEPSDAASLRWLDVFGQLIANSDRHFGNVAFYVGHDERLRLAPAYDMVPMDLAPSADVIIPRAPAPAPPVGATLDVWADAAGWARRFWEEVRSNAELQPDVRAYAERALGEIGTLAARVRPVSAP